MHKTTAPVIMAGFSFLVLSAAVSRADQGTDDEVVERAALTVVQRLEKTYQNAGWVNPGETRYLARQNSVQQNGIEVVYVCGEPRKVTTKKSVYTLYVGTSTTKHPACTINEKQFDIVPKNVALQLLQQVSFSGTSVVPCSPQLCTKYGAKHYGVQSVDSTVISPVTFQTE